jgi:hypothetical protein
MTNEIIITVQNVIQGGEQQADVPEVPKPKVKKPKGDTGILGALDAQFLLRAGTRIISSTGNNEISAAISKVARYGFQTVRALLPPNPVGIATLALTISADVLDKVSDNIRKQAKADNETDNARIKAGLLDISNVQIKSNWFSGRQTYKRV